MHILVAPNAFKDSLSAGRAAEAISEGIKKGNPAASITQMPLADGGEGTVTALTTAAGGQIINTTVKDPLMRDIPAFFGMLDDGKTAVVEMAVASGLALLETEERNPLHTTSYGTGQLIKAALDRGASKIIVGIGGSATNDGGVGMAAALGARFSDKDGNEIPLTGEGLGQLAKIDLTGADPRLQQTQILTACDVTNPLTGKEGAAYIYAPQKGANQETVRLLDNNLIHLARLIKEATGRDVQNLPGAGAAGGMGAGLHAFLDAELHSGFAILEDLLDLDQRIRHADVVITGEGSIDRQTLYGKLPYNLARLCKKHHTPLIALCGNRQEITKNFYDAGFTAIFSIMPRPMELEEALQNGEALLKEEAENVGRMLSINYRE